MPGLFLDADGTYRAALGCGNGLRNLLRRDGAGLGHSQNPLHAEHRGAQPGALGTADAQLRVYKCVHANTSFAESMARFAANYAYASGLRCGTIIPPGPAGGDKMNIQIFGTSKCFDTKKAQRYFKERGIKFQMIDLKEKGMSRGEFDNVARALGGWEKLVDPSAKDKQTLALLDALVDWQKEDKLFENQQLFKTPIVRNGRKATVGYQPDVWKDWE
jgi:arsenate reductase